MNEGLRQIGGLWMSIEKVLGPAFEYTVDGGIDESSNSWCGVQDFENEAEFTRECRNVCAFLLSRDSRNEGVLSLVDEETCGIVKCEDVSAIEVDWNLGGVYLDSRIEHWLVRIAKWRAKSIEGRKAKMAVCAAYLDSGEGRHDLTRLMFKSVCDELDRQITATQV
jgi:hypothetical protein